MSETREFARPDIARCLLAIFFPAISLIMGLAISYASGISQAEYYSRIMSSPPLMAKAVMNGTLGIIGIGLWGPWMLAPALRALYHRHDFLIEQNRQLLCLGRVICGIDEIQDVRLELHALKKSLIISAGGTIINAGDIAMCYDAEYAVSELKYIIALKK